MVDAAGDALIGVTLKGRYEVRVGPISGGMGSVYEARDLTLGGRRVAIKIILPQFAANPQALAYFERERKILAELENDHIAAILDLGSERVGERDVAYLVMPYYGGGTLHRRIADAPLSYGEAAVILRDLCAALDAAHGQNIFHRDIKPANILFTEGDAVHLSDFGAAKMRTDADGLEGAPTKIGTKEYQSYEQFKGYPVTAATDVYALGLVLHEMLTGRRPETGIDLGLPGVVAAVIERAIADVRSAPYRSAGALADAYETAYARLKREGVVIGPEAGRLEAAVAGAGAGATLHLDRGIYRLGGTLVVDKPLTLLGAGMGRTRVLVTGDGPVLRSTSCDRFAAQAIAFAHVGAGRGDVEDRAGPRGPVVGVVGGEVALHRCRFTGFGTGLELLGETHGTVRGCEARDNTACGILVGELARPTLVGNTCRANRLSGVAYIGNSGGEARGNTCADNVYHGIEIGGKARSTLEGNTCTGNKQSGIAYFEASGGEARGNICADNVYHGIGIGGNAQPTLDRNTCEHNKGSGIVYDGDGGGVARANTCTANVYHGIAVTERSHPELEGNTCRENKGGGIAYGGEGGGIARANRCAGNTYNGIEIYERARPELERNDCSGNTYHGIGYFGEGGGTAHANTCAANTYHGIRVGERARPDLEGNTCRENKESGIAYSGEGGGGARANHCAGNTYQGIRVGERARPDLEGNICRGNGQYGIAVIAPSRPRLGRNECANNAAGPIFSQP